ncbi:MAG: nuclear transport factor 2 family protein [Rubrivivax sp.]|nr:MAG: nuclear transport factor 2 family protein [Rubrivivax sp.]
MNDREELLALLQRYFDGLHRGDVTLLREAFHPQARLSGEVRGQVALRELEPYLQAVAKRASPEQLGEPQRMEVAALQIDGAIALATARIDMLGFQYLDQLSVLKDGGRWAIVHKLYTHTGS